MRLITGLIALFIWEVVDRRESANVSLVASASQGRSCDETHSSSTRFLAVLAGQGADTDHPEIKRTCVYSRYALSRMIAMTVLLQNSSAVDRPWTGALTVQQTNWNDRSSFQQSGANEEYMSATNKNSKKIDFEIYSLILNWTQFES